MVQSLSDIYTVFQKPVQAEEFLNNLGQEYEGIGIMIENIDDNITIISPFKGSPAEEAGIKANDIITAVDGISTEGKGLEFTANLIKGPAGTKVQLTIKREGKKLNINVTRKFILFTNVYG